MKSIAGAIVVLGGAYLIAIFPQGRDVAMVLFGYGTTLIVAGLAIILFDRGQK